MKLAYSIFVIFATSAVKCRANYHHYGNTGGNGAYSDECPCLGAGFTQSKGGVWSQGGTADAPGTAPSEGIKARLNAMWDALNEASSTDEVTSKNKEEAFTTTAVSAVAFNTPKKGSFVDALSKSDQLDLGGISDSITESNASPRTFGLCDDPACEQGEQCYAIPNDECDSCGRECRPMGRHARQIMPTRQPGGKTRQPVSKSPDTTITKAPVITRAAAGEARVRVRPRVEGRFNLGDNLGEVLVFDADEPDCSMLFEALSTPEVEGKRPTVFVLRRGGQTRGIKDGFNDCAEKELGDKCTRCDDLNGQSLCASRERAAGGVQACQKQQTRAETDHALECRLVQFDDSACPTECPAATDCSTIRCAKGTTCKRVKVSQGIGCSSACAQSKCAKDTRTDGTAIVSTVTRADGTTVAIDRCCKREGLARCTSCELGQSKADFCDENPTARGCTKPADIATSVWNRNCRNLCSEEDQVDSERTNCGQCDYSDAISENAEQDRLVAKCKATCDSSERVKEAETKTEQGTDTGEIKEFVDYAKRALDSGIAVTDLRAELNTRLGGDTKDDRAITAVFTEFLDATRGKVAGMESIISVCGGLSRDVGTAVVVGDRGTGATDRCTCSPGCTDGDYCKASEGATVCTCVSRRRFARDPMPVEESEKDQTCTVDEVGEFALTLSDNEELVEQALSVMASLGVAPVTPEDLADSSAVVGVQMGSALVVSIICSAAFFF